MNNPVKSLRLAIRKVQDTRNLSKNKACDLIGERIATILKRNNPYTRASVMQWANENTTITSDVAWAINKLAGKKRKKQKQRLATITDWPNEIQKEYVSILSMEERRLALKKAARIKLGVV